MSPFNQALTHTLGLEGNWSHHKLDPGGRTRFGITERLASRYGVDVETMIRPQAQHIYFHAFWRPMRLEEIARLANGEYIPLAIELFEAAVNTGTRQTGGWRCVAWLQQWLNRFNYGDDWPQLRTDGLMGPNTLAAVDGYHEQRKHLDGPEVLRLAVNASQIMYYGRLVDQSPDQFGAFAYGWVRTRGAPIEIEDEPHEPDNHEPRRPDHRRQQDNG